MALVSASNVRDYLPELSSTGADSVIVSIISRVEGAISRLLGFPNTDAGTQTLDLSTYTIYVDRPMISDQLILQLPIKPIGAITSVHSDVNRVYGSDTTIASGDYVVDTQLGRIILKPDSYSRAFENGYRANKVVLTAGYATGSPPPSLAHAICIQSALIYRNKATIGRSSINQRETTVKVYSVGIAPEVRELLYPFRASSMIL